MDETSQPSAGDQGATASDRADLSSVPCRRSMIETDEAFSGATLERLELHDGRRLVAKRRLGELTGSTTATRWSVVSVAPTPPPRDER